MALLMDPEDNEARTLDAVVDVTGRRVMEVGCGDGRVTWRYAAGTAEVTAFDPHAPAIEQAIAALPPEWRDKVHFFAGDVFTTGLPAAAYDVALLTRTLC